MVGNDVVDLLDRDADRATYRPGFDARVFGAAERAAIHGAADASRVRWRLWAAKEAAYKAARRIDPETPFSPIGFAVDAGDRSGVAATVRHGEARYAVRFHDGRDFVHAVATRVRADASPARSIAAPAVDAIFEAMLIGHARVAAPTPDRQSALVRRHAAHALAVRWGIDSALIDFERVGRIPRILLEGRPTRVAVSLSHHGDHVAWALALPPAAPARARRGTGGADERLAS